MAVGAAAPHDGQLAESGGNGAPQLEQGTGIR
jgi:hypothetical protein